MGIFKAKKPCTKNTIFTTSNALIYGGFMISLNDFYEQICRKRRDLAYHMSECEWAMDTDVLEEDHPEIRIELGRMREQFWSSEKIGTRVRLYSCDVPWETRHHTVNGQLELKEEYTELYDPTQECWKNLSSNLTKETFLPLVIEPFSINDIFKAHLMFASISFFWGKSIMSENENVAFKAFHRAAELFDKCIGMTWFNISVCNQKKLSEVRRSAGKKGGKSKAEVYHIIQLKLVELINDSVPNDGWKNKVVAVNELIEPLWDFIQMSEFEINNQNKKYRVATMSQDALVDTILNQWSLKNEDVKQAFDSAVRRKKRSK
ncbi:TPA: hypothetical protein PJH65_004041 [Raoultella ornithinolytica]|nr:hypothetical protein [Raoultella ornithinolytica]